MRQAGIPTADYRIFRSAPDAEAYILSREVALVVRSKGRSTLRHTLHCRTAAETIEAIDRIMDPREQLGPGVQVEIEERGERRVFSTAAEARDYVLGRPIGMVIKADGLAAGKGVYVCDNLRQALDAIDQIMVRRVFGKAGDRIIVGRTPRRSGDEHSRAHRRPHDRSLGNESGPQARLRPRRRPEYRRHGGVFAGRDRHAGTDGTGRTRDPRAGRPRHEARPTAVPGRAVRRLDADEPGAESSGVQRPARRSRNARRS